MRQCSHLRKVRVDTIRLIATLIRYAEEENCRTKLIGELARSVKRGFDETATKHRLRELERRMQDGLEAVADTLDLMREDLRETKM